MYTSFYGLQARPFQLTPDYRFYFDSRSHRKAVAYLTYGLSQSEGFVVITGEVGAGKTTLIDYLLSKLPGEHFVTGKVVTTQVDADDLLRMVATAFGLSHEGSDKATLLESIQTFLVSARQGGARPLLIIDEVQNLSRRSLEELRMLSNYQFRAGPLLQIYLVGQPQFRATMASADLEQLRQRVIATCHLRPLDAEETRGYIEHRLRHAGWDQDPSIAEESFPIVYEETQGIPRKINLLCDRLLLFGYLEESHRIDGAVVKEVVADMRIESLPRSLEAGEDGGISTLAPRRDPSETFTPSASTRLLGTSQSGSTGLVAGLDRLAGRMTVLERRLAAQDAKLNALLSASHEEPSDPESDGGG